MANKGYPVIEIFGPTIQGEGYLVGQRTHFVRFGGCTYRCSWCDTMYAVEPEQVKLNSTWLSPDQILGRLTQQPTSKWVSLSGGDPVMWDLTDLIKLLTPRFFITVETQGALWRDWLLGCDVITVSPKPPSSDMLDKLDHNVLQNYDSIMSSIIMVMKIVVFDEVDLEFARDMFKRYPKFYHYLTPGTPQGCSDDETKYLITDRFGWLSNLVLQHDDLRDVRVIPQLHVLAWGTKAGV